MMLSHGSEATALPEGLEVITAAIYDDLDNMVLRTGQRLQQALEEYPKLYEAWVAEHLPFGLDAARRMRMVWKASVSLPEHVLKAMPRAWQACYALTRLPASTLERAVGDGTIDPSLTVRESVDVARQLAGKPTRHHSESDLLVGRLVSHPPETLSQDARELLASWLRRLEHERPRLVG